MRLVGTQKSLGLGRLAASRQSAHFLNSPANPFQGIYPRQRKFMPIQNPTMHLLPITLNWKILQFSICAWVNQWWHSPSTVHPLLTKAPTQGRLRRRWRKPAPTNPFAKVQKRKPHQGAEREVLLGRWKCCWYLCVRQSPLNYVLQMNSAAQNLYISVSEKM